MLEMADVAEVVVVRVVVALMKNCHLHRCRPSVLRCRSGQDVPSEW